MKKIIFSLTLIAGTAAVSAQEAFIKHVTALVIPKVYELGMTDLGLEQAMSQSLQSAFNDKNAVFSLLDIQVVSGNENEATRAGSRNLQRASTVFQQGDFYYEDYVHSLNAEQLKQIKLNLYNGMREINDEVIKSITFLDDGPAHYQDALMILKNRELAYRNLYAMAKDASTSTVLTNNFDNEVHQTIGRKIMDLDAIGTHVLKMKTSSELTQFLKSVLVRIF